MDNLKSRVKRLQQAVEAHHEAKKELRDVAMQILTEAKSDLIMFKQIEDIARQAEYILKDQIYDAITKNSIDFYKKDS